MRRSAPTRETRCGVVALVGQPNVGKSTLLNALVGEHLAIVSRKPQATREPVVGILTEDDTQLIFVDQPGLLEPEYLLQEAMREAALASLRDADVVLHLFPAGEPCLDLEALVPEVAFVGRCLAVVRTQADRVHGPPRPTDGCSAGRPEFVVSAKTGAGMEELIDWCRIQVPMGPFRYDPDDISTQPLRFFAAEFIRETAFDLLGEELPYSLAVEIDEFREGERPVYIRATVYVERESQRRMVIGKSGRKVRALGTAARGRMEDLLGQSVYLDLWVKVLPKWRTKPGAVSRFGLTVKEKTRNESRAGSA